MNPGASQPIAEILSLGMGMSIQDSGRRGWRKQGVPVSGAMDDHAMVWANRLLDNPPTAPVLELLLQGARLRFLASTLIAVTGADATCSLPRNRVVEVKMGDEVTFPRNQSGVWTYLAIRGGFQTERPLGSASAYPRGKLGVALKMGDSLQVTYSTTPEKSAGRFLHWSEVRNFTKPPALRVWPGPQWDCFTEAQRDEFFQTEWQVSSQSDRVGYRLSGPQIVANPSQIISEPVRVGSIQIPANGQPIVTMRDGPTVGGYSKLGVVDPADISWLAQCRPGLHVRFQAMI